MQLYPVLNVHLSYLMTLYLYVEIRNFQKVIVLTFDEMNLKEKVAYLCFDRKIIMVFDHILKSPL